jgi:hypothetical protein
MASRLQRKELVMLCHALVVSESGPLIEKKEKQVHTHATVSTCTTEAGIEFNSGFTSKSHSLCYMNSTLKTVIHCDASNLPLHPVLPLPTLDKILRHSLPDELSSFYDNFKLGIPGYSIRLLNSIKFDGTPYGLMPAHIYCSPDEKISSGKDSETYGRFDWIEINAYYYNMYIYVYICR